MSKFLYLDIEEGKPQLIINLDDISSIEVDDSYIDPGHQHIIIYTTSGRKMYYVRETLEECYETMNSLKTELFNILNR